DPIDTTYFQVRGPRGEVIAGEPDLPLPIPPEADKTTPGTFQFQDETLHGSDVRVAYSYVYTPGNGNGLTLVQIAETTVKRTQLANDIIKSVIFPQFFILPLAI